MKQHLLRLKKPLHRLPMKLLPLTKRPPTKQRLKMKPLLTKLPLKKQPKKRRLSNPAASGITPKFQKHPGSYRGVFLFKINTITI